jgi:hypothetical protein
MPDRPGRRTTLLAAPLLAAIVLTGCEASGSLLDAPFPVQLRVEASADAVEVDAPAWYAERTHVFLCPVEPPFLPDPGPARQDWQPARTCHDFGRIPSDGGLTTTLALADLTAAERSAFAASPDWYLLLVDVGADGRAIAAARTRFAPPDGFTAS